jgi:peptidoglycan-associated lipoprotein
MNNAAILSRPVGGIDMHAKIIGVLVAFLLLAACSSPPPPPPPGPPGPPGGAGGIGSQNIVPGSQQDLEASAGDRVFFAFDRSDVTPESQQILARQADWLRRYPNVTVTIEGHCDERGTREYNLALGERRAQAVKNVLVASGIPASRISTISYGKERPIVVGSNEEAWAQNRVAITTVN